MKVKPLVSILINNYNYGRFLQKAIDSALNQTYSHLEVIIVDDGSADNSREIIASYGNTITPVLKGNGGQASAFNAGFAVSQGDIICFLDSDDIFLPEKVAEVVAVFGDYQDSGWCFHPLELVSTGTETFAVTQYKGLSGEYDLRARVKRGKLGNSLPFSIPATSGLCYTRTLLQLILPMPEAEAVSLSDNYLKFTALALSKGFALNKKLAFQRLHDNNIFTTAPPNRKLELAAKINVITAYWMRIKFPELSKFTNNSFALGLGFSWHIINLDLEYYGLIEKYLSSLSTPQYIEIILRAFYYYIRAFWVYMLEKKFNKSNRE